MPRWIGLLGSWALLVLGVGMSGIVMAGEWINLKESRRLRRVDRIDEMIRERMDTKLAALEKSMAASEQTVQTLQSKVASAGKVAEDLEDSTRTIIVSTSENKVYVRENGRVAFEAICSTGKGTTLIHEGRTMVFDTPVGKFRIVSKEKDPVWVPPDWHYVEEARKEGLRVVRLGPGDSVDADTGGPVLADRSEGVWSWFGESNGKSQRVYKVKGNTVLEISNGVARELPPGQLIRAGDALIVPPVGTSQRKFAKVLGNYRLNLGQGYALHGTQMTKQLGQSVSHGCVRLADADIEHLYNIASVGDEVLIY